MLFMDKPTKSVKISEAAHQLLSEKAELQGKKIQWLIERAILRCYGTKEKP